MQRCPPVIGAGSRVLILGACPSAHSLAKQQYYANPENAFWSITNEFFGFELNAQYDDRLAASLAYGVALWVVLYSCHCVGNTDSAIEPKRLAINNFSELFTDYSTTTFVYFNSAKAAKLYYRLADHHLARLADPVPAAAINQHGSRHAARDQPAT
ncbi:DNA-deoxyinosine glycosylase [Mycobacterium leprae]|nr:DNA-deoxyinosine glycosylase [Mycobacterium leprae]